MSALGFFTPRKTFNNHSHCTERTAHMPGKTTECQRCGQCCLKGGPALHSQDLVLISEGHLRPDQLITVRKGEMAASPLTPFPQPTEKELVKLQGKGKEWSCLFFNDQKKEKSCGIYCHRPLECKVFQCWAPDELHKIIGHDTLGRQDILAADNPAWEFIIEHERECPPATIAELLALPAKNKKNSRQILKELNELTRKDLAIRQRAVTLLNISTGLELFLFGRPYFVMLTPYGLALKETAAGMELAWNNPKTT